jgi:hypothetical protein
VGDEQRVRTMAGWIGVEISRSRVRTPGKVGYGLYRVRGLELPKYPTRIGQNPMDPVPSEWTAYAFTLEQVGCQVALAIRAGTPAKPGPLNLYRADSPGVADMVPTRWTTAYRGRRDLGAGGERLCGRPFRHQDGCVCLADGKPKWMDDEPIPAQVKPEFAAEVSALDTLVGAGLMEMRHVEGCACDDDRYTAACVRETTTPRQRQRADNAAFQAEHLERRAHGLRARYAAKLKRSEKEREGS